MNNNFEHCLDLVLKHEGGSRLQLLNCLVRHIPKIFYAPMQRLVIDTH